ncbi:SGNH/GDSL hydrolase family protein [Alkalicoccobacillus plakortidis]|uniref:SGNH/GDSL hydrolase family protein n=1 Tax=Alkalicoccobacillus plakortidis TaxID=444060 RepID=A0ABT0XJ15_9BACI|nr:SGNH/GDSL hydrolase family protein [Alkalicoccobacillus plakortidis]MCM2675905.1 SGNH/GDSL hydrolase family protein [Alkalicoccobacillus plakortidis]
MTTYNQDFSSKHLLIFGDSIAHGNENNLKSFATIAADKLSMPYTNYARGGATITSIPHLENDLHIHIEKALSEGAKADYIVFNGMTNDIVGSRNAPLGEVTEGYDNEFDESTFCGGFESICKKLKINWLGAKVLYVRPHNMKSRDIDKQIAFGNKALEVCRKWSIPYLDLYTEGGLNTHLGEMNAAYTINQDGTHPNTEGYELFYVNAVVTRLVGG